MKPTLKLYWEIFIDRPEKLKFIELQIFFCLVGIVLCGALLYILEAKK